LSVNCAEFGSGYNVPHSLYETLDMASSLTFAAPFSATDLILHTAFDLGLTEALDAIENLVVPPALACVTLWIIIQGFLVMRGDIDARRGITKLTMVALVVGLVAGEGLYQQFVQNFFENAIPEFVQEIGINPFPVATIPAQLDVVFAGSEELFQTIAAQIGNRDEEDSLSFTGAQDAMYLSLWIAFGICDTVDILTALLIAIGPLILIGYLFDATRPMTMGWIKQLVNYGLLLLLLTIVATIVIATDAAVVLGETVVIKALGQTAAQIVGLYELDMFFLTGDALIVALPALAAVISGGVSTMDSMQQLPSFAQSQRMYLYRQRK
jgi:type IV secretion system protein VirB6